MPAPALADNIHGDDEEDPRRRESPHDPDRPIAVSGNSFDDVSAASWIVPFGSRDGAIRQRGLNVENVQTVFGRLFDGVPGEVVVPPRLRLADSLDRLLTARHAPISRLSGLTVVPRHFTCDRR